MCRASPTEAADVSGAELRPCGDSKMTSLRVGACGSLFVLLCCAPQCQPSATPACGSPWEAHRRVPWTKLAHKQRSQGRTDFADGGAELYGREAHGIPFALHVLHPDHSSGPVGHLTGSPHSQPDGCLGARPDQRQGGYNTYRVPMCLWYSVSSPCSQGSVKTPKERKASQATVAPPLRACRCAGRDIRRFGGAQFRKGRPACEAGADHASMPLASVDGIPPQRSDRAGKQLFS